MQKKVGKYTFWLKKTEILAIFLVYYINNVYFCIVI